MLPLVVQRTRMQEPLSSMEEVSQQNLKILIVIMGLPLQQLVLLLEKV